jgi:hypothetical protein
MIFKFVSAGALLMGVVTVVFTLYNVGPRIADDLLMGIFFITFGGAVGGLQLLREIRDGVGGKPEIDR